MCSTQTPGAGCGWPARRILRLQVLRSPWGLCLMKLPFPFASRASLVGLDIGLSTLKLVELEFSRQHQAALVSLAIAPTPPQVFTGGLVSNPGALGAAITQLFEQNEVSNDRVAIAMPGSSTFSKQLRVPRRPLDQLAAAIRAEAVNFIPQDVDSVKLDFHVLGSRGEDEVDVLVVAVREEVLESYRSAVEGAGLSLEVVDVDFFALQNCFEFSDPAAAQQTVGLIDVGSSMSSINICRAGSSIFTGDISIGVGALIEAVRTELNISRQEAREVACAPIGSGSQSGRAREIIDARLDKLAVECDRQLNFFWKAAGAEGAIDRIVFSGGGACVRGIAERIGAKTGIAAEVLNPLRQIRVPTGVDDEDLRGRGPLLGVAVGLALRAPDDRIVPECIAQLKGRRGGRGGVT